MPDYEFLLDAEIFWKALKEAAAAADKVSDSASKKVNSVTGDEASVQVLLCSIFCST